jgi:choline dehydrogenase-like flavoprotein
LNHIPGIHEKHYYSFILFGDSPQKVHKAVRREYKCIDGRTRDIALSSGFPPTITMASAVLYLLAVSIFSGISCGYPQYLHDLREREIKPAHLKECYDYIVVGGGQSGIVIGSRLSEDPDASVLVVEYGYIDTNPDQIQPSSATRYLPRDLYNITGTGGGSSTTVYAAAVVGGGSTVNGMLLNRGSQEDYNNWAALGNKGWDWDGLFPYFRKSSTFNPPAPQLAKEFNMTWDLRAFDHGPIQLSFAPFQWPGIIPQFAGMVEAGVPLQIEGSINGYGAKWEPAAIDPRTVTRSYAVSGYYNPVSNRTNLHLLTGWRVNEVLFNAHKHATGISMQERGTPDGQKTKQVKAKNEIVLTAGWLHTPQVLQRSGIGPSWLLRKAGIPIVYDSPGVGSNFQDHAVTGFAFNCK